MKFLRRNWKNILVCAGLVVIILALQIAYSAQEEAKGAAQRANETTEALKTKIRQDQKKTITGRIGACGSSIDLRNLLSSYEQLVAPDGVDLNTLTERQRAFYIEFRAQTEKYVNHNPNCDLLTPKQRAQAIR